MISDTKAQEALKPCQPQNPKNILQQQQVFAQTMRTVLLSDHGIPVTFCSSESSSGRKVPRNEQQVATTTRAQPPRRLLRPETADRRVGRWQHWLFGRTLATAAATVQSKERVAWNVSAICTQVPHSPTVCHDKTPQ